MSFYKKVNKTIDEDLSLITCDDRHTINESQGSYSNNFLGEALDKDAIRELEIYMDNDQKLYDAKINNFYKNLILKICQGKYDSKKAVKLFMYLVERAAKAYSKEIGDGKWNITFPKKEREEVAKGLVTDFEDAIKNDEFDWVGDGLVPKKYAKINLAKSLKQGKPVMEGRGRRNSGFLRESRYL